MTASAFEKVLTERAFGSQSDRELVAEQYEKYLSKIAKSCLTCLNFGVEGSDSLVVAADVECLKNAIPVFENAGSLRIWPITVGKKEHLGQMEAAVADLISTASQCSLQVHNCTEKNSWIDRV